jgi:spore germination protein YaaH
MNWCKQVAAFALSNIGQEKLVMGIPFYGRAWGDTSTSRALVNTTTENIKKANGISEIKRVNGVPTFTYDVNVKVTVYYEDEYSLATRIGMYKDLGVETIGFWRLGQETTGIWSLLSLDSRLARK